MGEFNVNKSTGGLEQTAGMPSEYPATQVMLSDGVTSVEDAVDEISKIGYFDCNISGSGITQYNFTNDKPSDVGTILSALAVGGNNGAVVTYMNLNTNVMMFDSTISTGTKIRVTYIKA